MRKAVILFNLGGPDSLDSVEPFLFNLFNDPAIISIPSFLSKIFLVFIPPAPEYPPRLPSDLTTL